MPRFHRDSNYSRFAVPILGLAAFAWFLIRVIPKPSRAAYPCMKAAAPLSSGFILWIIGIVGSAQVSKRFRISRRAERILWGFTFVAVIAVFVISSPTDSGSIMLIDEPANEPIGEAQGLFPGRVVWVHDPDVTDWAGPDSGQYWYEQTDQDAADSMVSQALLNYTEACSEPVAWETLFRFFNTIHDRGDRSYEAGEKIGIKINLSTCNARDRQCDDEYNKVVDRDRVDNSPQILHAVLGQLTRVVGISGADITIGDPTGLFPRFLFDYLDNDYPQVKYLDNRGTHGRSRAEFSSQPLHWSSPDAQGKYPDYIPRFLEEADYVINIAVLKAHHTGITLCAKNHFGSLIRLPDTFIRAPEGGTYGGYRNYFNLHTGLSNAYPNPGTGKYRSLVDLMGHDHIGGKTLLSMVDGLFGGYMWEANPHKWHMPPFGDGIRTDWPSSIFLSMDQVAIDSVGFDFLRTEWPDLVYYSSKTGIPGGADDYLHEAALASQAPSGTTYDPNGSGTSLNSLGVHENWNNATDKQYSRNLGTGEGIELIHVSATETSSDTRKNHE